jgi:hypothetical protein
MMRWTAVNFNAEVVNYVLMMMTFPKLLMLLAPGLDDAFLIAACICGEFTGSARLAGSLMNSLHVEGLAWPGCCGSIERESN